MLRLPCFAIWESESLIASLHRAPCTPGVTEITRKSVTGLSSIFRLSLDDYKDIFLVARKVACLLCQKIPVQRCALLAEPRRDGEATVKLIPLHGLGTTWKPHLSSDPEYNADYPGYTTSKNGPRTDDDELSKIQRKIWAQLKSPRSDSYHFYGTPKDENLFARIVRGEEQQWRVWEDEDYVAFLTPFPNRPGFTVVVPRRHLSSDIFGLDEHEYVKLVLAARKVVAVLTKALDVEDCAIIFEGFEIDYAHVKLIPFSTSLGGKVASDTVFFSQYEGYVTSKNGPSASAEDLEKLQLIISANK